MALSGSDEKASEIFQKLQPQILRYIQTITSPHDAEDILQETFITFLEHSRKNTVRKGEESAWLYRVAHNRAIDFLRRSKKLQLESDTNPEVFLGLENPDRPEWEKNLQAILQRARHLALHFTQDGTGSLLLHMIEENREKAEIARTLNISERHLRRKVIAFYRYLQSGLEKEGYENPFNQE